MTRFGGCADHAAANRCEGFAAGFSLIEVMVAMVIALLGVIVMAQVFTVFEGQRRTTTGGDDAITSGAIALYGIQRDIQQSGWGISTVQLIGCNIPLPSQPVGSSIPLVPVRINPRIIDSATGLDTVAPLITGQDANTDTLLVVAGTSNGTVEGDIIISQSSSPVGFVMTAPTVFSAGDLVVAIPSQTQPTPCTQALTLVVADSTTTTVMANPTPVASTVEGPRLFNLGPALRVRAYAIRNGNLTVCDYWVNDCGLAANNNNATIWLPIANDIVSLRAEYGRDANAAAMDGEADVWDQTAPIPATPVATKNTIACGLFRISAVRVALVARSSQPEKAPGGVHVTTAAPTWAGGVAINLTLTRPDLTTWPMWQDFRYKVFQTVVPLRNITSAGVREEC